MKLTSEEKAARREARTAEKEALRLAWEKEEREDAALNRKVGKALQAYAQLEAWFPDKHDVVHLAGKGDATAIDTLVHDGNSWGDPVVARVLGMIVPDDNPGMQAAVRDLWTGNRRSTLEHLPTSQAKDLLRRYGTKPVDYPKTITVYRGGYGFRPEDVAQGWSWTTDLPTAAFFVDYQKLYAEQDGRHPFLLKATVHTRKIVHVDDERGEEEKVLFGVKDWEVLGTPEDWAQWLAQHKAGRLAREAESMARWHAGRCPTQAAA